MRSLITILFLITAFIRTSFAGATGQLPFEFRHGLIWIKVASAGQSLNFVLDSGAGSTVLNLQTAQRLKMKLGAAQSVRAVQGTVAGYEVDGFKADFGGIPVRANVLALDLSKASQACGRTIDGLLGQDFFRGRIVQIDFASKCLRLNGKSDPCRCCASLPLRFCNDAMSVPVSVDGSKPRWTRLDTGCDDELLWVSGLPGVAKAARVSIGISNACRASSDATVQLGDERIPDVKIALHGSEIFPGEAGLLGNGILSRYCVTIDAVSRRVFLAKS